jgi:hypothetical protein
VTTVNFASYFALLLLYFFWSFGIIDSNTFKCWKMGTAQAGARTKMAYACWKYWCQRPNKYIHRLIEFSIESIWILMLHKSFYVKTTTMRSGLYLLSLINLDVASSRFASKTTHSVFFVWLLFQVNINHSFYLTLLFVFSIVCIVFNIYV